MMNGVFKTLFDGSFAISQRENKLIISVGQLSFTQLNELLEGVSRLGYCPDFIAVSLQINQSFVDFLLILGQDTSQRLLIDRLLFRWYLFECLLL